MIEMQLTYDVLATLAFRNDLLQTLTDGFRFLGELSRAGKIAQARFIARRRRIYRYCGHARRHCQAVVADFEFSQSLRLPGNPVAASPTTPKPAT
jgi:hypothetical protein